MDNVVSPIVDKCFIKNKPDNLTTFLYCPKPKDGFK